MVYCISMYVMHISVSLGNGGTMNEQIVKDFEKSVELTNKLYEYLKANTDLKLSLRYSHSYFSYFKLSELNEDGIVIDGLPFANNEILIHNKWTDENQFYLRLWKYKKGTSYTEDDDGNKIQEGNHFDKDIYIDINKLDFESLIPEIFEFFEMKKDVQLSLF